MTDTNSLRTRKDGSIDYDYYIARSRAIRSTQAHQAAGAVARRIPDPLLPFRYLINKWRAPGGSRNASRYLDASR
ncbi:hypothetical protein K1W69_00280 [Hoeflea sp. WL0058]|uniref:Uncharacterized protein n=1 Tax=Flavimaribacter sediminis TaxID=2865987 RepID=A0AAE2ZJ52_9HYPH|nr:hypothetical protein [Flavimaribacter sediminis]MBW8635605.1 hypothetical protein [Flavimaribacter sediminis]